LISAVVMFQAQNRETINSALLTSLALLYCMPASWAVK